jgi:predicted GNAT family N-acyltransferase
MTCSHVFFKGSDNPEALMQVESFRLDVWKEILDHEAASARFGLDQFDYESWHFLYLKAGNIIGCGRLIIAENEQEVPDLCSFKPYLDRMRYPMGVMNRLVVHRDYRGNGVAQNINQQRVSFSCERSVADIWIEVQAQRCQTMERFGFELMGPSLDKTIPGDWRIMCNKVSSR